MAVNKRTGQNHGARDQYGNTYLNLGPHPRKALMGLTGRKHVSKMYRDCKDGITVHCGYVISGRWFDVFTMEQWHKPC